MYVSSCLRRRDALLSLYVRGLEELLRPIEKYLDDTALETSIHVQRKKRQKAQKKKKHHKIVVRGNKQRPLERPLYYLN